MKILILENSLDDLLNVKISVNGGQSYTDYEVSSLKNGGLTLDCNPSDLKVICDTNILNYIKVFADGEKSISNVNLSDYLKYRDAYIDVYKNPYYGKDLPKEEADKLQGLESTLYENKQYQYYCSSKNFRIHALRFYTTLVPSKDDSIHYYLNEFFDFSATDETVFINSRVSDHYTERLDDFYYMYFENSANDAVFRSTVRVYFIKHF